jgi:hypothetical protein
LSVTRSTVLGPTTGAMAGSMWAIGKTARCMASAL